ncbi:MAG: zf-HC2 domain-containing protein [Desulfobacterales bacterium]|jgi:anti-sigma factor RsiW
MTPDDHDHHKCLALFEQMSAYIDRELNDAMRARMDAHLRACCHCQACFETLQRTVELCQSTAQDYPLPDMLTEKLRALIGAVER